MSRVALSAVIVLSLSCCCVAQDTKSGFEFLKQFEGKWWSEAVAPNADSGDEPATKTSVVGKTVGKFWLVMEHRGQFGEMEFNAIQTVGYDKEKKAVCGYMDRFSQGLHVALHWRAGWKQTGAHCERP